MEIPPEKGDDVGSGGGSVVGDKSGVEVFKVVAGGVSRRLIAPLWAHDLEGKGYQYRKSSTEWGVCIREARDFLFEREIDRKVWGFRQENAACCAAFCCSKLFRMSGSLSDQARRTVLYSHTVYSVWGIVYSVMRIL